MSVNRTVVSGNLTRDPEEKRTQGGVCVLEVGIAVEDRRKNSQTGEWESKVNFIECSMFGQRAEGIIPYLAKGMHVTIDGHLRQDRWEKDGKSHSRIKLIVDDIDFTGNKRLEPQGNADGRQDGAYDEDIPF